MLATSAETDPSSQPSYKALTTMWAFAGCPGPRNSIRALHTQIMTANSAHHVGQTALTLCLYLLVHLLTSLLCVWDEDRLLLHKEFTS